MLLLRLIAEFIKCLNPLLNNMDTAKKTIAFSVQAVSVTSDLLKEIFRDYISGKMKSKGKTSYGQLSKQGKLDSIEVTDNNIKDFLKTARKYDIDYALKRDKSTSPPTYHIFFTASNSDTFKKAFQEYAVGINKKLSKEKSVTQVVNREQIKTNAKTISQKQSKIDKEKNRSKSDISGR